MRDSVDIAAYAKLNLALAVGAPVPPRGYHPIASWFACIDLHDRVSLKRTPKSACDVRWAADAPRQNGATGTAIDWPIEKDLGFRAHKLLEQHVERELPTEITVEKRIPAGGGLGGGSADAAAVLRGLNSLWALGLPARTLHELAGKLGSDIAFFIDNEMPLDKPARPALVTGLGETIERVPHVAADVVLLLPSFGCPTGEVYKAFDAQNPGPIREQRVRRLIEACVREKQIEPAVLFNDLAGAAEVVAPELARLRRDAWSILGTPVHVTGSGSTMFAIGSAINGRQTEQLGLSVVETRLR